MDQEYYQNIMDEEYIKTHPEISYMNELILKLIHNKITDIPSGVYVDKEVILLDQFVGRSILYFVENFTNIAGREGYYLGILATNLLSFYSLLKTSLSSDETVETYKQVFDYYESVWNRVPTYKSFLLEHISDVKIIGLNITIDEAINLYKTDIKNGDIQPVVKYVFTDFYSAVIQ